MERTQRWHFSSTSLPGIEFLVPLGSLVGVFLYHRYGTNTSSIDFRQIGFTEEWNAEEVLLLRQSSLAEVEPGPIVAAVSKAVALTPVESM
jgi:hypothetical protein